MSQEYPRVGEELFCGFRPPVAPAVPVAPEAPLVDMPGSRGEAVVSRLEAEKADVLRQLIFGRKHKLKPGVAGTTYMAEKFAEMVDGYCEQRMPEAWNGRRECWIERPDGGNLILRSNQRPPANPRRGDLKNSPALAGGFKVRRGRLLWRPGLRPGRYDEIHSLYIEPPAEPDNEPLVYLHVRMIGKSLINREFDAEATRRAARTEVVLGMNAIRDIVEPPEAATASC